MTQAMRYDRNNDSRYSTVDVDELLAGFAAADDRSRALRIEELYHHYKPLADRHAKRQNSADFEGITDLALFDTFRALTNMQDANDVVFRSYLFRAIESHLIKEGRKSIPIPVEVNDQNAKLNSDFESNLVGTMHLGDLIEELPEDQRAVFTHRIIHGRSADETGLILGKKTNAIYQLQHRATKRLQRMLLGAALLLIVVGTVIVIARQAESQIVDSSPARPTIDNPQSNTTSTTLATPPTSASGPDGQTPTEVPVDQNPSRLDVTGLVAAGGAETDSADTETIEIAPAGQSQEQETTAPETPVTTIHPAPPLTTLDAVTTTAPTAQTTSTTATQVPTTTTSTTTAQVPTTESTALDTGFLGVFATDDVLRLTVGQSVDFSVLANDGPRVSIDTVTWISGFVDGLSFLDDGRITGIATEAGTDTIVYRLNGNNDTSDTAFVQIIVE